MVRSMERLLAKPLLRDVAEIIQAFTWRGLFPSDRASFFPAPFPNFSKPV